MAGLRIVTTGLAVCYPLGGVFWDYLQYPLGLAKLGHEVLYLEDTGKWSYDAPTGTFIADGAGNARAFAQELEALAPELAGRWFFRDAKGAAFGLAWDDVVKFCRQADLLVDVSASCWREVGGRSVLIDSDPVYTQAFLLYGTEQDVDQRVAHWMDRYDAFFSFGENIGSPDCAIPSAPFGWRPTRQPVVLDCFAQAAAPNAARRRVLTTVASWRSEKGWPVLNGIEYEGKSREWERFLDLPSRSALPLEIAMSGPAPMELLRAHGWRLRPGSEVSDDASAYRSYLANSYGEWSVAKNAYVASKSGWFSCRSACYLALGVPVVVQDTGFTKLLPTGKGLLTFSSLEEAAAAIAALLEGVEEHERSARAIAHEYFDSAKVLTRLVQDALA
jgi:hypothetical protein